METLPPNKEETLNVSNYSYLKPNESLVSSFAVFPSIDYNFSSNIDFLVFFCFFRRICEIS